MITKITKETLGKNLSELTVQELDQLFRTLRKEHDLLLDLRYELTKMTKNFKLDNYEWISDKKELQAENFSLR